MSTERTNTSPSWIRQREIGQRLPPGHPDHLMKSLYSSVRSYYAYDNDEVADNGIYNLAFSPDGSLLVAVGERKSIIMFDPVSQKLMQTVQNAHSSTIGYAKFLDSRMFGTCSDDNHVSIWDARSLKSSVQTLRGHTNRVRNLEFVSDGLLISSGVDGNIFAWNLNQYSENECVRNRLLHFDGLTRMRLTPDSSKMVVSTNGGYLMIIHDLDLDTVETDFNGFRPNIYRLMQVCKKPIPIATAYTHLFSMERKSNRAEFISDFPRGDAAKAISSLEIHPQGWCAVSRNLARDDMSEWSCTHDIQEKPPSKDEDHLADKQAKVNIESSDSSSESSDDSSIFDFDSDNNDLPPLQRIHVMERTDDTSHQLYTVIAASTNEVRVVMAERPFNMWETMAMEPEGNLHASEHLDGASGARNAAGDAVGASVAVEATGTIYTHFSFRAIQPSTSSAGGGRVDDSSSSSSPGNQHLPSTSSFSVLSAATGGAGPRSWEVGAGQLGEAAAGPSGTHVHGGVDPRILWRDYDFRRSGGNGSGTASGGNEDSEGRLHTNAQFRVVLQGSREESVAEWIRGQERRAQESDSQGGPSSGETAGPSRAEGGTPRPAAPGAPRRDWLPGADARWGLLARRFARKNAPIQKNTPRLTHYIEEPNVAKEYTKELSFSPDGRLICSPYDCGLRILAFSPNCSELSVCCPVDGPVQLYEVARNISHDNVVVSTAFSPRHHLIVSGCLSGKILWYQPVL
ncbi:hypothetical protein R5R35_013046 [Gryllus longicercus]|uniref:Uncharacterized protein n=1 Tax=Gryllus longicercus TaxID=2509291 RepID=A0AAN9Z2G7_9ORTH